MIPLLINVEVTGRGAKKEELPLNAEDILVLAEALMRREQSTPTSLPGEYISR